MYMAVSLFAINTEGYCTVTPSLQCRRILGGRKLVNRIATMKPPSLIL